MNFRTILEPKAGAISEELKTSIIDTKDNTDIIQEQLLVLMDAIAELYETVALGGE